MNTPVWISLGSNVGDRRAILNAALERLNQTPGVVVTAVSSYHETQPVGGPAGQGPFLNAAARLDTSLSPRQLLTATQAIETNLGRVRTIRWGDRTLDLDLLIYGSKFVDESDLKLPHPRLTVRRFVLEPLAEIASQVVDTITRCTIADLMVNVLRRPRFLMIDDLKQSIFTKHLRSITSKLSAVLILSDSSAEPIRLHDNSLDHHQSNILRQLETIEAGEQHRRASGHGWLVANFVLDVPRMRKSTSVSPQWVEMKNLQELDQAVLYERQLNRRLVDVPDPTFILAAPGSSLTRKPAVSRIPIYWPEATEPDAIVAELVAVCRGIEGV